MKTHLVIMFAGILTATASLADESLDANIDEGKAIIQSFMGNLQSVLQSSMQADGPVGAIEVCNTIAPQLALSSSQMSGWQVGRTSLKVRSEDNAPDAWERIVLEEFEARKAAGENPQQLSKAEIVEENGEQVFRMMKAIPTGEVCTSCHGSDIAEPVAARLAELYPEDQARGFRVGDLRGAFTLRKPLI